MKQGEWPSKRLYTHSNPWNLYEYYPIWQRVKITLYSQMWLNRVSWEKESLHWIIYVSPKYNYMTLLWFFCIWDRGSFGTDMGKIIWWKSKDRYSHKSRYIDRKQSWKSEGTDSPIKLWREINYFDICGFGLQNCETINICHFKPLSLWD